VLESVFEARKFVTKLEGGKLMEEETLRRELLVGLEYAYAHEDWVMPLDEALHDLTAQAALWRQGPSTPSIWEIVLHLAVWNENIVQRVTTGKPVHPDEGAWPALPEVRDGESWEAAKNRLQASIASVKTMIEETPLSTIQSGPWGIGDLLCRFTHVAYHLGQITRIREDSHFNMF